MDWTETPAFRFPFPKWKSTNFRAMGSGVPFGRYPYPSYPGPVWILDIGYDDYRIYLWIGPKHLLSDFHFRNGKVRISGLWGRAFLSDDIHILHIQAQFGYWILDMMIIEFTYGLDRNTCFPISISEMEKYEFPGYGVGRSFRTISISFISRPSLDIGYWI